MKDQLKKIFVGVIIVFILISTWLSYSSIQEVYDVMKPLTSFFIIAFAWIFGLERNNKYFLGTLIALIFCLIGDAFLLRSHRFLYGLIAFLIAHILFLYSFLSKSGWIMNKIVIIILSIISISYFLFLYNDLGDLKWPVAFYVLFIVLMSWQGISQYTHSKSNCEIWVAVGVCLFMISDMTLAYNKFVHSFQGSDIFILLTYWAAIFFLTYRITIK